MGGRRGQGRVGGEAPAVVGGKSRSEGRHAWSMGARHGRRRGMDGSWGQCTVVGCQGWSEAMHERSSWGKARYMPRLGARHHAPCPRSSLAHDDRILLPTVPCPDDRPCVASDHQLYGPRPTEGRGPVLVPRASIFSIIDNLSTISAARSSTPSVASQNLAPWKVELRQGLFR